MCDIGLDAIFIYRAVGGGGGNPNDLDGDGYTNDDEIANGTDPNNAGRRAARLSTSTSSRTSLDPDDDNERFSMTTDKFAVDADNGATTPVGTLYDWENEGRTIGGLLDWASPA